MLVSSLYNRVIVGSNVDCPYGSPLYTFCWVALITATSVDEMLIKGESVSTYYNEYSVSQQLMFKLSSLNATQPPLAPQALSMCNEEVFTVTNRSYSTNTNLTGTKLSFPIMNGQNFIADITSLLDLWNQTNRVAARWIEPPDLGENTPSIAAVLIYRNLSWLPPSDVSILTCSIYASWQGAETYIVPNTDTYIHSSITDTYVSGFTDGLLFSEPGHGIKIDVEWANLALPPNNTVVQLALGIISDEDQDYWEVVPSLSLLVADALARIEMDVGGIIGVPDGMIVPVSDTGYLMRDFDMTVMNISDVDMGNATALDITVFRYGYSYSMSGITRRLAVGVLLTHVLIVLVHTVLLVYYKWRSPDLKSLLDLFILAIESDKTAKPAIVGIANPKEYSNYTVKVQELSDSNLGLVLDDHR